ncbi:hypothetical protein [Dyadobacter pollutisoli]|uniref:Lipoprotein n=1 Tax=Dyadobacter pollutisoli TaxID=2910158 RepID=A0A9E8NIB7_9BACT|nr:hypothetical protein [Dyadobacter pollutisoli]WAC14559.1 hypothetical protein ON006_11485 [Dyadobacter pollutisoli]
MKSYIYLILVVAALLGCIHSAPIPDELKASAPDFGTSKMRPYGETFTYPAGIKVIGKPHWDLECIDEARKQKRVFGSGSAVHFCIQLANTTGSPIVVVFPPGTVFISESIESQNGILVQGISMEVPPQSAPVFHIFNNCINADRDITDYNVTFEPVPIISDLEGIAELTMLLADKRINSEDYNYSIIPSEISVPIQIAVNDVAHTGELSAASREAIGKLPRK